MSNGFGPIADIDAIDGHIDFDYWYTSANSGAELCVWPSPEAQPYHHPCIGENSGSVAVSLTEEQMKHLLHQLIEHFTEPGRPVHYPDGTVSPVNPAWGTTAVS